MTALRFLPADGGIRAFDFVGDPGPIALEPRWYEAAARFIRTGWLDVLRGADYWLFLFVLAMPLWPLRALVPAGIACAVAEAITLSPSSSFALDVLWFQPLLGSLIALSILYMAIENGVGAGANRRWILAFACGLVLGCGFSVTLRDTLQFAGTHPVTSLVSYAAGADVGQMFLLLLVVSGARLISRLVGQRAGTIIMSLMAGDIAWHWTGARLDLLRRYQFQWPTITPALALAVVAWMTDVVIAAAVFWLLYRGIRWFASGDRHYRAGETVTPAQADTGTSIQ